MNLNINQKNTFGKNEVGGNKIITVHHKVGFVAGVLITVVAEILIRIIF